MLLHRTSGHDAKVWILPGCRAEEVEVVESNQVYVDCDVQDVANKTSASRAACGKRCESLSLHRRIWAPSKANIQSPTDIDHSRLQRLQDISQVMPLLIGERSFPDASLHFKRLITHTNITHPHRHHLVSTPSNTCTTRTTSRAAESRTAAQSATCVSPTSHATRVSPTDHTPTSRHRRLSLATAAAAHESGHETASAAAAAHAGVDALLIALLVASVAFAGAETHGCLW